MILSFPSLGRAWAIRLEFSELIRGAWHKTDTTTVRKQLHKNQDNFSLNSGFVFINANNKPAVLNTVRWFCP